MLSHHEMNSSVLFQDLGTLEYRAAWDLQEQCFHEIVAQKLCNREHPGPGQSVTNRLFFVEHPHVYTLGKSGKSNNLLIDQKFLTSIQATYVLTNRGGDITYHGPGQLVGYPIFDLESMGLSIKGYIHLLEEAIIGVIAGYGLSGQRLPGATGVWLDTTIPDKVRKISAIGVRASRYVTMHGFALNVNTDLQYFRHIHPCGFVDKGVTSLESELGYHVPMDEVKAQMLHHLQTQFNLLWI